MTNSLQGFDIAFIDDRRQLIDRRQHSLKAQFPLLDSQGCYVKTDCRNTPDRRLSNIQVKEIALNGHIFDTLFCN